MRTCRFMKKMFTYFCFAFSGYMIASWIIGDVKQVMQPKYDLLRTFKTCLAVTEEEDYLNNFQNKIKACQQAAMCIPRSKFLQHEHLVNYWNVCMFAGDVQPFVKYLNCVDFFYEFFLIF